MNSLIRRLGEHSLFTEVKGQIAVVLEMAYKAALAKLPRVAMQPLDDG